MFLRLRLRLRRQPGNLDTYPPSRGHDGHLRVPRLVGVHVDEQGEHGDEASDGEDVDGGGGLFADVDLLVGNVVADGKGLRCLHVRMAVWG